MSIKSASQNAGWIIMAMISASLSTDQMQAASTYAHADMCKKWLLSTSQPIPSTR